MSNDTEVTYNLPLIDALNDVRVESKVSYEVLSELLGCKKSITYKYLKKKRTLVRGDIERRATVVARLLEEMVHKKILPLEDAYIEAALERVENKDEEGELSRVTTITLGVIDDYLAR